MQDYIPRKIDINGKIPTVFAKQYDNMSRFLHIQILDTDLDENDPETPMNLAGCEVRLYVERPEGPPEFVDGEVANAENGVLTFMLPNSVTDQEGNYNCEIRISSPAERATLSTKGFLLKVEKSIYSEEALQATESFSALENALFQLAVDKARLNNLAALATGGSTVLNSVESEVVDIRTGYDGTTYTTAGGAVRGQIQEIHDSVATTAEFLAAVGVDYDENEEAAKLVSDLESVLKKAESFQGQINNLNRSIEQIAEFMPDGGITNAKLSAALQRPDNVVSAGTVAELLQTAQSYFNYAYTADGKDSGILYESHTGLYSESLGTNAANKQYGMVCSSFADALLNAISFENSRYSGKSSNIKQSWGVEFDSTGTFGTTYDGQSATDKSLLAANKYLTSQNLARYATDHGYLYAINSSSNVRAGDVVFSGKADGRYLGIDHVAVVINTDGEYCTVVESYPDTKTDNDGTAHDVGLRIHYWKISHFTYGATFPLGDVDNTPEVLETAYGLSGNTNDTTFIHEFTTTVPRGFYTIVCHGEVSEVPYVSLTYSGTSTSTAQSGMHRVGNDCYLTVYAQKPATVSVRMAKSNTYSLSEISLYKGYAEITARAERYSSLPAYDTRFAVRLAENANLNACAAPTCYYSPNASTTATLVNLPTGVVEAFRLEVKQISHNERYMQTLYELGHLNRYWVRYLTISGTAVTAENWYQYQSAGSINTAERFCSVSDAVQLFGGNDLNNCKIGVWWCPNSTTAQAVANNPLGSGAQAGFRVESGQMSDDERYMQTLWYIGTPEKMYVRMYVSTGWTGWFVFSGAAV